MRTLQNERLTRSYERRINIEFLFKYIDQQLLVSIVRFASMMITLARLKTNPKDLMVSTGFACDANSDLELEVREWEHHLWLSDDVILSQRTYCGTNREELRGVSTPLMR